MNPMTKPAATAEHVAPGRTARPPVVVIVGHIDHGKTTLLDAIRESKVAEKEAGGITQAIGAYQIEVPTPAEAGSGSRPQASGKITFIDTPGHESFSAMRARGAHVADIAVLVVAADEGPKPQTDEALKIIREYELPFVVALNKIDKPDADANRVKQQLAERSVLVEGYGGTTPVVEISAKEKRGLDHLLETILLLAELEELTSDPNARGTGVVIESHMEPKRGAAATLLIEDGTVNRGEYIAIGNQVTPIRIFEDFRGASIERADASGPIRIVGFRIAPALGECFQTFATKAEAEAYAEGTEAVSTAGGGGTTSISRTVVNIIIKTDTLGSKEALEGILAAVGTEALGHKILKSEVGDVNESDVKLALASKNTFIVGFRVKVPPAMRELANRHGIPIVASDIIYELADAIKAAMVAMAPSELQRIDLGSAKILALFKEERGKQIVGGKVAEGVIRANAQFDVIRNQRVIGKGKIVELQSQRQKTTEVAEGQEFGMLATDDIFIGVGDTFSLFT